MSHLLTGKLVVFLFENNKDVCLNHKYIGMVTSSRLWVSIIIMELSIDSLMAVQYLCQHYCGK